MICFTYKLGKRKINITCFNFLRFIYLYPLVNHSNEGRVVSFDFSSICMVFLYFSPFVCFYMINDKSSLDNRNMFIHSLMKKGCFFNNNKKTSEGNCLLIIILLLFIFKLLAFHFNFINFVKFYWSSFLKIRLFPSFRCFCSLILFTLFFSLLLFLFICCFCSQMLNICIQKETIY